MCFTFVSLKKKTFFKHTLGLLLYTNNFKQICGAIKGLCIRLVVSKNMHKLHAFSFNINSLLYFKRVYGFVAIFNFYDTQKNYYIIE